MTHDPELVAETRAWLLRGLRDLEAGAFGLTAPSPFTEDAVFHAQQAAEKALKGILVWHGVPFRKTHSLEELGAQCEDVDLTAPGILRLVAEQEDPAVRGWWQDEYLCLLTEMDRSALEPFFLEEDAPTPFVSPREFFGKLTPASPRAWCSLGTVGLADRFR